MILSNKCSFSYYSKLIIKRKTCDRFDRVVIQSNESLRTIMAWALLLSAAINRIFMNRMTRHSQYTVLTIAAYCIQYVWFHAYPLLNCWIESFCMSHDSCPFMTSFCVKWYKMMKQKSEIIIKLLDLFSYMYLLLSSSTHSLSSHI